MCDEPKEGLHRSKATSTQDTQDYLVSTTLPFSDLSRIIKIGVYFDLACFSDSCSKYMHQIFAEAYLILRTPGSIYFLLTYVFVDSVQDLTAINVKKTGHRKKILSESAKLEGTTVFPTEKPVSLA